MGGAEAAVASARAGVAAGVREALVTEGLEKAARAMGG